MDIAVVDDEKMIREHICSLIGRRKPESCIESYATGEELLASGKRFDIVFLDIQVEGMNGIEAARCLQEAEGKGAGGRCLYPVILPAERQPADPESGEQF